MGYNGTQTEGTRKWLAGGMPCRVHELLQVLTGSLVLLAAAAARYAAKLAGLYPEDPWEAAVADQAYLQAEDCALVGSWLLCCCDTCTWVGKAIAASVVIECSHFLQLMICHAATYTSALCISTRPWILTMRLTSWPCLGFSEIRSGNIPDSVLTPAV